MLDLYRRLLFGELGGVCDLVQTQVEAYILTLVDLVGRVHMRPDQTYRSMHVPGTLFPTQEQAKLFASKASMYHGLIAAERSRTRPPNLSTLYNAITCSLAAELAGSNQSMESMTCAISIGMVKRGRLLTTAMVRVSWAILAITSLISSVCMRRPSKAPGLDSLACALTPR